MSYLREFHFLSVVFRLLLSVLCAGFIGFGRSKHKQHAGFRTYILTCLGATLSIMIAMYQYQMLQTLWAPAVEIVGLKFDASRFSASVISGIGFLAAGTIISGEHQQKTGLTTAAGLFACAIVGIAIGAGFYEIAILAVAIIYLVLETMFSWEIKYKRRHRNITIYVEMQNISDVAIVTDLLKNHQATIFEMSIENSERQKNVYPSAIFTVRLSKENRSHSYILSTIACLDCVRAVEEIIA